MERWMENLEIPNLPLTSVDKQTEVLQLLQTWGLVHKPECSQSFQSNVHNARQQSSMIGPNLLQHLKPMNQMDNYSETLQQLLIL